MRLEGEIPSGRRRNIAPGCRLVVPVNKACGLDAEQDGPIPFHDRRADRRHCRHMQQEESAMTVFVGHSGCGSLLLFRPLFAFSHPHGRLEARSLAKLFDFSEHQTPVKSMTATAPIARAPITAMTVRNG